MKHSIEDVVTPVDILSGDVMADEIIGKEGWFTSSPKRLMDLLKSENLEEDYLKGRLVGISPSCCFLKENSDVEWDYFIPEKNNKARFIPFDLSLPEDREKLRDAWVRHKSSGNEYHVAAIITDGYGEYCDRYVHLVKAGRKRSYDLLSDYEFVDGTPCGKLANGQQISDQTN